ncbi:SCO4848 family membrane protein [Streptomyces xinghaiensis]|uniref:SCO4848 family membrane protein n=1 Tax=Streptomyces xinghaiensis TaxID=1038928 RepID=UPI001EE0F424|nr:hypothetical protein [Streptomyces xinghaiensis]
MPPGRRSSWFLLAFGVWSWFIWTTFARNLWGNGSGLAFDDAGEPTAYFWVHLLLAVTSLLLGTAVGLIGLRGVRARRAVADAGAGRSGQDAGRGDVAAPGTGSRT